MKQWNTSVVLKSAATVEYSSHCLFFPSKNVSCQGEFLQFGSLIWLPNFSAWLLPSFIWWYYTIYLLCMNMCVARHIKIQIWERHTYVLYMFFHLLILPIQIPRIYVSSSWLISNSSYRKRDLYLPFKQIFVAISHHRVYVEEICNVCIFFLFYVPTYAQCPKKVSWPDILGTYFHFCISLEVEKLKNYQFSKIHKSFISQWITKILCPWDKKGPNFTLEPSNQELE